jgi:NTE family protein
MIAFVLSGAGARGPLQVGALQALLEAEIRPDFLVGTSAGAVNASYVASRGLNTEALAVMHSQWKKVKVGTIYPGGVIGAAFRLLRNSQSLYPNDGLRRMIREGLPEGVTTFGNLQLPLYVTSVDILSGRLFLFGEDPRAPIEDAVLASSSIPAIHPPVEYHGLQLVDGGVLANVAASVAMDKGATQVYALNAGHAGEVASERDIKGVVNVLNQTLTTMMAQSLMEDLARAEAETSIDLHHVVLRPDRPVPFGDFSRADELALTGYETTKAYLAAPRPRTVLPREPEQLDLGEVVPGARQYIPSYWLR